VVHGDLAVVSGQVPIVDGAVLHPGHLGDRVDAQEGAEAARRAALQALSALRHALGGSFARLERILQVTVFVAAEPDFVDHPKVANAPASCSWRSWATGVSTRARRSAWRRSRWARASRWP